MYLPLLGAARKLMRTVLRRWVYLRRKNCSMHSGRFHIDGFSTKKVTSQLGGYFFGGDNCESEIPGSVPLFIYIGDHRSPFCIRADG